MKIKYKSQFEDNLLGWQLAVLDYGFTFKLKATGYWEAFDQAGHLRGVWGNISWHRYYGWIRDKN